MGADQAGAKVMSSDDKGRLARWSQRKTEARRRSGGAAPTIPEEPANIPAAQTTPPDGMASDPQSASVPKGTPDLPDIESLKAGSDFAAFMKDGVPADLRRLALRKLWASDPIFNVIDEMVEYGEDYTDAATVVAGLKSAWEAGRGYADKTSEESHDEASAPEIPEESDISEDQQIASGDDQTASEDEPVDRNEKDG
jgi:hypothetical protein